MGYPPPSVVVLCNSCSWCYLPTWSCEYVKTCPVCQTPADYPPECYEGGRLQFPDGKWMFSDKAACDLILCDVGLCEKPDEISHTLIQKLLTHFNRNPFELIASLPTPVLRDVSDEQVYRLRNKLADEGFTTDFRYHPYSWECSIHILDVGPMKAALVKRISERIEKSIMDTSKLLTKLPAIILPGINVTDARELSAEFRELGADSAVVHFVELQTGN